MNKPNKLECLTLADQASLIFAGKARSLHTFKKATVVLASIKLGWEGLQRTNTLPNFELTSVTKKKVL
jgi:hypothetical protein